MITPWITPWLDDLSMDIEVDVTNCGETVPIPSERIATSEAYCTTGLRNVDRVDGEPSRSKLLTPNSVTSIDPPAIHKSFTLPVASRRSQTFTFQKTTRGKRARSEKKKSNIEISTAFSPRKSQRLAEKLKLVTRLPKLDSYAQPGNNPDYGYEMPKGTLHSTQTVQKPTG